MEGIIISIIRPLGIIFVSVILGVIFQKTLLKKLARLAARTKWKGDEVLLISLKGVIPLWFFLLALYFSLQFIPLSSQIHNMSNKALLALAIGSVTLVLSRIGGGFIQLYATGTKGKLPSSTIFMNLTKIIILTIGLLVILQALGIPITPLLTALGVGGLAVALALQDTLANLFAGVHILISRQVRPGDYVRLDTGEEGCVTDISWRNTTIKERPDNLIIIPNSKLASTITKNYTLPRKMLAVLVEVGVSYDSDLEKVEKVTKEVAEEVMREVEGGVPEFEPLIRYHTFADFSINFTVILRAKDYLSQFTVRHEFIKRLHRRYNKEGIEIPFPIRTVYMRREKD